MYSPLTIISSDITESFAKKKERKKERKKQINHYGIQVNKSKRKEKKSKLETFGYPFTETTIEKFDRGKALINEYI